MNCEIQNNILDILIKEQDVWLKMAKTITKSSKENYKDFLHDFYLIIFNKIQAKKILIEDITHNGSVNKAFIYKMMRNIYLDQLKKEKEKFINYNLENLLIAENKKYIDIEKKIDEIVNGFYWFDKKLFNLYRREFKSIRKLSKATKISHVVVWRTINNCIKIIKKKINENRIFD
tara:strand:+ start:29 stop:553 length:525 start_codon:yes stop_codon:yes gene_type:complete